MIASIDIQTHKLVPKHEIVPKDEKKEILEKFNLKKEQLPKILVSDPAIKAMEAKPGDIIRISRKSATAGQYTYYRLVVG